MVRLDMTLGWGIFVFEERMIPGGETWQRKGSGGRYTYCRLSSVVEQRFCKPRVISSNLIAGSDFTTYRGMGKMGSVLAGG